MFLAGNGLPEAWAGRDDFTIGETGFGTGLNFCAVADLWLRERPAGALLHYFSIEAFPLNGDELTRALAAWPELHPVSEALTEIYPAPVPGLHRIHFEDWGIVLTLAFGEAGAMLNAVRGDVDAWFLDGFAPSRNPEMWRPEVLSAIGKLTVSGGCLATFTAAGLVRRGLADAGFEVAKVPGFGRKRDMVVACKKLGVPAHDDRFARRAAPVVRRARTDSVAIIGGGIAGASLAHALRRRGGDPTLLTPSGLGSGASGNPYALVMPRMDAGDSPAARFHAAAYRFAVQEYRASGAWHPIGVLVLLEDGAAEARAEKARAHAWHPASLGTLLDPNAASEAAGLALSRPALFYPEAGLVCTDTLLTAWTEGIRIFPNKVSRVVGLQDGQQLLDDAGTVVEEVGTVILAAGAANAGFSASDWLPLQPVRGQLSVATGRAPGPAAKCALSWGGYLAPTPDGNYLLGATHDAANRIGENWGSAVVEMDHERNHASLPDDLSGLLTAPADGWHGRARLRAVTPDRVPLFGAVPEKSALLAAFDASIPSREGPSLPGSNLLVLGGLGSRGFVTAPLASELLAARLYGEVWPVEETVGLAGEPSRFLFRAFRRGGLETLLG